MISVLNACTDSLHSDSYRLDACLLDLQCGVPTFDIVIKVLTEHVKGLKGMVLFNKQFSEALVLYFILFLLYSTLLFLQKNFLQEISSRISIQRY